MKSRLTILLLLLSLSGRRASLVAQTQQPPAPRENGKGMFRPYSLWHFYYSIGFAQWDQQASRLGNFNSFVDLGGGFSRTAHKRWWWGPSFQIDPGFSYMKRNFTEQGSDLLPDTIDYVKERYRFSAVGLGLFNRISLATRGKSSRLLHPSFFIDIGVMARLPGPVKWVTDLAGGGLDANLTRSTVFLRSRMHALGFVRVGTTGLAAFAQYQFTSFFRYDTSWPEPPRLSAGLMLEIPLFKRDSRRRPPIYYSHVHHTD